MASRFSRPPYLIRRPLAVLARVVEIDHGRDRIHAQPVDVILLDPEQRIGDQKITHLVAAVIEDLRAPLLMLATARIGVLVQRRAIEVGETVTVARKVRRHPIHEHADARLMQAIDEAHEVLRRAVPRGGREMPQDLIAPRAIERMLRHADQLDVRVAHVDHIRNQLIGQLVPGEERGLAMPGAAPRAGMQFINGDRRAQRIPVAPAVEPLGVAPAVAVDVGDD